MKISKSKQELARIISENGGWQDGEFAAQDGDGSVGGYQIKPEWDSVARYWWNGALGEWFLANKINNLHRCILSRAEYFHLYPAPDADGWIEFDGTECPSGCFNKMIDVKLQDGRELTYSSCRFDWDTDGPSRITAYRLHKQERAKSTAVGDDETNLAAKEELEAMEYRESPEQRAKLAKIYAPSIESLASDYRNKLDFANRKQDEADKANMDSDAALSELEAAIASIGFAITPLVEAKQEPELVITDWQDLRVGDVIQCVGDTWDNDFEGNEAVVTGLESNNYKYEHCIRARIGEESDWGADFIFIRRP